MRVSTSFLLLIIIPFFTKAQERISYAKEIGNTIMNTWKDSFSSGNEPAKWPYDQDIILQGMRGLWKATGDGKYFSYIQKSMDLFLDEDGNIRTYKYDNLTLDNIAPRRDILLLYNVTGKKKYLNAVNILRKQLNSQPSIHEVGFWA